MDRGLKLLYTYILKSGWKPVEYKEDHLCGYVNITQKGYMARIYLWKTNNDKLQY